MNLNIKVVEKKWIEAVYYFMLHLLGEKHI